MFKNRINNSESESIFCKVYTLSFEGTSPILVTVEISVSSGLPIFNIVGLPDKTVAEARERIKSALTFIGLSLPPCKITVNMSPANIQKEGSHYDLPIAVSILVALDIIDQSEIDDYIVVGELSLNGEIMPVKGVLCASIKALEINKGIICPYLCMKNAFWSGNNKILAPKTILSLVNHFKGIESLPIISGNFIDESNENNENNEKIDMSDVIGQDFAKKGAEIACAGGHNILFIGPPGTGKSLIANRMKTILPKMSYKETLETAMIYDVCSNDYVMTRERPFRSPHHSASVASIVGGGSKPKPGEISLAHNGILFMDELPEFSRIVLESLRQPMENGFITIARANGQTRDYLACFQFVGAMNMCMCGNLGRKECANGPKCAEMYQRKISGPLMDRIDIRCYVRNVNIHEILNKKNEYQMNNATLGKNDQYSASCNLEGDQSTICELEADHLIDVNNACSTKAYTKSRMKFDMQYANNTSQNIRKRVALARGIQIFRQGCLNAKMSPSQIQNVLIETDAKNILLEKICEKTNAEYSSMRSYSKILCISRTIADLRLIKKLIEEGFLMQIYDDLMAFFMKFFDIVVLYNSKNIADSAFLKPYNTCDYMYFEQCCTICKEMDLDISSIKDTLKIILQNTIQISDIAEALSYRIN